MHHPLVARLTSRFVRSIPPRRLRDVSRPWSARAATSQTTLATAVVLVVHPGTVAAHYLTARPRAEGMPVRAAGPVARRAAVVARLVMVGIRIKATQSSPMPTTVLASPG